MADNNTRSQVYRGLSSQTLVVILMGVLEIGVFALMSRLLTPEDFGYYAIIVAVIGVFQCITEAGLGSAVIQRSDATKEFISTALGWSVIFGVVFSLLSIILARPLSELMGYGYELTTPLRWMSITILLFSVNSVARAMFMKTLDFMKFGWCQVLAYVLSSGLGIALAIAGYGVKSIVASAIANAVLMTIILFAERGSLPSIRIHSCYNKDILSYGGWLTGSVIVRRITTELDKFILTRWIPVAQIGAYNRPSGFISSIVDRVNGIYDTVLFPILSSFGNDGDKLRGSFLTAASLVSWASMIVMAGFVLSARIVIDIFFGAEWEWLVVIFRVLSLSILFLAYSRIGDCYFRSLGWVKAYFYIRLAVCFITSMCVYVGCKYGITGVAIGVLVSRFMDSVIKLLYLSFKLSVRFWDLVKAVLIPTWVTMLMTVGCYMMTRYISYGEYTAVLLFAGLGLVLLSALPRAFGKEYYENVYLVVKSKIERRHSTKQNSCNKND